MLEIYGKEYDVHWGEVTNTFTKVKALVKCEEVKVPYGAVNSIRLKEYPGDSDCGPRLDPRKSVGWQGGEQG